MICTIGMPKSVKKSSLSMIDMTHYSDYWCSLYYNLFALSFVFKKFDFFVKLQRQSFYGIDREKLKLVRIGLSRELLQSFK